MTSFASVKAAAAGRWVEILSRLGGIDAALLDGKGHPCPRCGGVDRFSLIDASRGALLCRQCFAAKNGDGIAAVAWLGGCSQGEAAKQIAEHLGLGATHHAGNGHSADAITAFDAICAAKRMPPEAVKAFGGRPHAGGVFIPMVGPDAKPCSGITLTAANGKGIYSKGKPTGLFLPSRRPAPGETWVVVEGSKDAAALFALGHLAAGLPGSAMNAKFARLFDSVNAIVLADGDQAGRDGAAKTAKRLRGKAASIKLATCPDGQDARDVIAAGGAEAIERLLFEAVEFSAQESGEAADKGERPVLTNAEAIVEEADGKEAKTLVPLPLATILRELKQLTGDWPRRIDNALFINDTAHGVGWLNAPAALFGWLRTFGAVVWHGGPATVKQPELFAELQRTAPSYRAVADLPHEPPMADHYYTCPAIEPGNGDALRSLLGRFSPATDIDRDLIQAALMTALWGGPPGCRPCFVVTSDDGRGVGKSTLAHLIGDLFGGTLEFSHQDEIGVIKTRLLSPDALPKRVCLLDNVKTLRFSWSDLEGLLTAPTVGGHRMYCGEASRPNTLVWFATLNGAALSTDMAQRAVIVKLVRPERSADWEESARQFVVRHQMELIGDLIAALREPPTPLHHFSRWAMWERDILQRLPEPADAQRVILERQAAVDVEGEEIDLIEDCFADQLRRLDYTPEADRILVPSRIAARWLGWATNQSALTTTAASRMLNQFIDEGRARHLTASRCKSYARGFVWCGDDATFSNSLWTDIEVRISSLSHDRP